MEFTESNIPNIPTAALTEVQLTSWNQVMSISLDPLKEASDCKRFAADSEVKQAVTSLLQTRDTNFYYLLYFGLRTLVAQLANILNSNGERLRESRTCIVCYSVDIYVFRLKAKFSA